MSALNVNLDLVKKYNVPGPRYTSYPPATKFTSALTWPQLFEKIAVNNRSGRGFRFISRIPFCETLCWFCGCTTGHHYQPRPVHAVPGATEKGSGAHGNASGPEA